VLFFFWAGGSLNRSKGPQFICNTTGSILLSWILNHFETLCFTITFLFEVTGRFTSLFECFPSGCPSALRPSFVTNVVNMTSWRRTNRFYCKLAKVVNGVRRWSDQLSGLAGQRSSSSLSSSSSVFSQPSIYIDGWLYGMSMTSVVCNVPVLS